MTSSAGDLLDLDISGIAHGGVFVARHEGRVVFVSDAVPGERVRARLSDVSRPSFWRAETVEVLDPSEHRRPHVWAEADVSRAPERRPGGADLGHIALDHQRELKQRVLAEALDRFGGGGLDAPAVQAVPGAEDGTGWRTRLTLHVDDAGQVGPYAARSHTVIPVTGYPLATEVLSDRAREVRGRGAGKIDLVQSSDGEVRALVTADGRRPKGKPDVVTERVGERRFRVDANGFWQVHHAAATALDSAVRRLLAGRVAPDVTHYDLYGGVGLFAATLADLGAGSVVTVESNRRATAHAQANLQGLPVAGVTARVDRFLSGLDASAPAGVVVLDPPRSGAGRAVVERLDALRPEAIVYVACDPVAFARDLGTFRERGWSLAEIDALDLFPHSHHFEVVALLER